MGGCLNFSLTSYKDRSLHKAFEAAGLEARMINISNGSTIHCWISKDYSSTSSSTSTTSRTTLKEDPSNGGESKKPVLVLIHGFGASAVWQWEEQLKAFLPHFTLILPDLVFFGLSTTASSQRSESFQAECMWLVLDSLGIQKFSVVGTSYGGFVAYRLAQAHEDAVDKIVLSNSSICMTLEDDQALCKRGNAATIPDLLLPTTPTGLVSISKLAFNKPPPTWFVPSFILQDHINVLYNPNRARKVELLKDLVFGKENAPAKLAKVDKDVLIVWGENDRVFLTEQAERIKNYLGERAQLVILPAAGHVSQIEQPAKWNSLVLKFLLK